MERGPHRDFYRETEKLDYLTEEQKSIVCDYIDTWTENYPATYAALTPAILVIKTYENF